MHRRYWIGLGLLLLVLGCREIISPDVSGVNLTVNSPADSLYTAEQTLSFWWEADADAEQYQLRITKGTNGNVFLLVDTMMLGNETSYSFADEGLYEWEIRVVNAGSESPWQPYSFAIDRSAPEKASALTFDGDTLSTSGTGILRWESSDVPLDNLLFPTRDSLLLYRRNDSTEVGARLFFDETAPREQAISSSSPNPINGVGEYFWQVVTFDRAGNRKTSDLFQFEIR